VLHAQPAPPRPRTAPALYREVRDVSACAHELLLANLHRDAHDWWIRLLLTHGQTFVASPLPDDVPTMTAKWCYLNAYRLAASDPERFDYYEGYGALVDSGGWPVAHAWCVEGGDRAVDPTWWGISTPPAAYHGIRIPLAVAEPHAYEYSRGTYDWWLKNEFDDMERSCRHFLSWMCSVSKGGSRTRETDTTPVPSTFAPAERAYAGP
jgi:hypothetical protein